MSIFSYWSSVTPYTINNWRQRFHFLGEKNNNKKIKMELKILPSDDNPIIFRKSENEDLWRFNVFHRPPLWVIYKILEKFLKNSWYNSVYVNFLLIVIFFWQKYYFDRIIYTLVSQDTGVVKNKNKMTWLKLSTYYKYIKIFYNFFKDRWNTKDDLSDLWLERPKCRDTDKH